MNGIQINDKPRGYEKSTSGCLGRMVNLFDLTSGVSGNRLLTDNPHNDGSSLSRSQSYVSAIATDEIEDLMVSELRSSSGKTPNGTPVKMLIAQEMSQDSDSRQSSPNVVARLMGLDALPQNRSQFYTQKKHSENSIGYCREEQQSGYKDIYENWQQSQRTNCTRDKSPQNGRSSENVKLALIRQKFMEAKRLSTDEKLRQTKEFQDALDVLSSNGDLFLKVLQEPNSFISKNLDGQSFPPPETKRITVLRPSKMVPETKRNEIQTKNQPQVNHVNLWDHHHGFSPTMSTWKVNDTPAQPTRIVVLKPSPAKVDVKPAVSSSNLSSPRILHRENSGEVHEDEAREAREVAKEITLRMRDNLSGHRRDETLLSSVLSNGYTGDESSFEKSDNEFHAGNLSDSEVISPISRHSWDYVNRYGGSPCSSSFSHASYSPDSSVCREAKKRLFERWAMIASNGSNHQEQPRHVRRSSSTLGEMLALSEIKNSEICEEEEEDDVRNNIDQDSRASTSCINTNIGVKENGSDSPRSFARSKSVPVSSTLYGEKLTPESSKEATKTKASKISFAGKVTSLFFSRSKKIRNEKISNPQSDEESKIAYADTPGTSIIPQRTNNGSLGVGLSPTSRLQSGSINGDLNDRRLGKDIHSQQGGLSSVSHTAPLGIHREKQDEPSPISVLELPFEEDERVALDFSRTIDPNPYGGAKHVPSCLSRSNLIDKSPPIGSIARTLSWDECSSETPVNYPEDNVAEWRFLVQSLLTMAGLEHESGEVNLTRWHSPESPLDPLLKEKFINLTAVKDPPLHEAKRRQMRSTRKLVFDCVNAALADIGGSVFNSGGPHHGSESGLGDRVWGWMKDWFSGEVKLLSVSMVIDEECGGDSNSLVEKQVKKEVVGKCNAWEEHLRLEIHLICRQIVDQILDHSLLLDWT